ncbi:glycoside hydrolase family 3 N-terminal domain-containing protein [Microbacterium album]|uniref:beta-N-acetylhexosaminidase n=1 Tax=Microbacterium album TaxID=2053191 RepID=A0A917MLN1_9MICO|nr:glycoside hydrolase family 3 N-terminal domain-containing protein [Microbacterium album]GGH39212.1 hypothetical protein GCM10010921_10300 [Microbacterium album]
MPPACASSSWSARARPDVGRDAPARSGAAGRASLRQGLAATLALVVAGLAPLDGAPATAASHATPAAAHPASADGGETATREELAAAIAGLLVDQLSPSALAASVVMGHVGGTDAGRLRAYAEESGVGGFILMSSNVPADEAALRALTDRLAGEPAATLPLLLGVDQEGGDVRRLPWDELPAARDLQQRPPSDARAAFEARGRLLEGAGIAANFGIVADLGTDVSGFIRRRALGTDPAGAARRVAAAVAGERPSAFSTLKHFPGHGAAPGDSHVGIPETSMPLAEWRRTHALPFVAGIDAGAELVMTGHLRFTAVDDEPASLSAEWYRILREDLGFEGVAITDDLGMLLSSGEDRYADPVRNAVDALAAGADMVMAVAGSDAGTAPRMAAGIVAAVERGELAPARLREAATRVATLRVLASGLLD